MAFRKERVYGVKGVANDIEVKPFSIQSEPKVDSAGLRSVPETD
jgi:hypothetical protein